MTLLEDRLRRQLPELADSFVVPGDLRARVDRADRRQRRRRRMEAVLGVVALLGAGLAVREGVVRHDRTTPAAGTRCSAVEQLDEFYTGVLATGTAGSHAWTVEVSGTGSNPSARVVIDGLGRTTMTGRPMRDDQVDVDGVSLGLSVTGDARVVFGLVPTYVAAVVVESTANPGHPIVLCARASGDPTMNWVAPTALPFVEAAAASIVDDDGHLIGALPLYADHDGSFSSSITVRKSGN